MLYQANLPKSFWAEAITTATYLINLLPSEAINDEIPYEKWHQKQLPTSALQALKPFGCIVHIHVPKERQKASSKLNTQSTTGCFVVYTKTTTMWRGWDFKRKVFVNSHEDGGEGVVGRGLALEVLRERFVEDPTHDVHLGSRQER